MGTKEKASDDLPLILLLYGELQRAFAYRAYKQFDESGIHGVGVFQSIQCVDGSLAKAWSSAAMNDASGVNSSPTTQTVVWGRCCFTR